MYKFTDDGADLELVHKVDIDISDYTPLQADIAQTEIDDVPLALLAFQGRLVAGVGKALRIYDIGKKKMLRKAENKVCCNCIIIQTICSSSSDFWLGCRYSQHSRLPHSRWRYAGVGLLCRL